MKKLIWILSLALIGVQAQALTIKPLSLKDSVVVNLRSDGDYDVTCKDGSAEVITASDLSKNNLCPFLSGVKVDSNILAIYAQNDGTYNVICKDKTVHTQVAEAAVLSGAICVVTVTSKKVDILFVVDNSGSMAIHQKNLADNISVLIAEFEKVADLDYQIGVITSDCDFSNTCGKFQGSTKVITPSSVSLLSASLLVGTNGSGYEKFFDPVVAALSEPNLSTDNVGFLRTDARLALVFITDAEDQSAKASPQDTVLFLTNLKGSLDNISVYGAYVSPSTDPKICMPQTTQPAQRMEEFFSLTNAKTFSLCDANFGKRLSEMGQDIVTNVNH
jgi:hypothetical protein